MTKKQTTLSSQLREMDMTAATLVAEVSSFAPGRTNWTEFRVWYQPEHENAPFIGEQVGETTVPGQKRFVRRACNTTIQRLLKWFPENALSDDLEADCLQWAEVFGPSLSNRSKALRGYRGSWELAAAMRWLYPESAPTDWPALLESDFRVTPATTIAELRDNNGAGRTWVRVLVSALRHFDRDAFHAARS